MRRPRPPRPLGKPATRREIEDAVTTLLEALDELDLPLSVQAKIDRIIDLWPEVGIANDEKPRPLKPPRRMLPGGHA